MITKFQKIEGIGQVIFHDTRQTLTNLNEPINFRSICTNKSSNYIGKLIEHPIKTMIGSAFARSRPMMAGAGRPDAAWALTKWWKAHTPDNGLVSCFLLTL